VQGLGAQVHGRQQPAAGHEHALQLGQRSRQICARDVDERVERGNAAPRASGHAGQGAHVAGLKRDIGVEGAGLRHHAGGEVHAQHFRALVLR
jgi:hypothetical protein